MESSLPSQTSHVPLPQVCIEEEEKSSKTQKNYREMINTLPSENGWRFSEMYLYQGFWCTPLFLEGVMSAQEHFMAQPTDIMVCSAPKSGTTWLKALAFAIVTRTHFDDSTNPLLTTVPHDCIPFLEMDAVKNPCFRNPNSPLLATHIPYTSLPKSITSLGCKIVYICRDPKDAFVSMWLFARKLQIAEGQQLIPLEEAFELVCSGAASYGPYWDHVLGYWKASLEWPERVLFLKYEVMMRDTVFYVKRLAEFMDYPFSLEEEREGSVQKIIKLCSFENLSNLEVNKTGIHRPESFPVENNVFFRKGKVGDWQNYLTAEMGDKVIIAFMQFLINNTVINEIFYLEG